MWCSLPHRPATIGALSLVLGLLASPALAAGFEKGPYLIFRDDNTAMTVLWQTDAAPTGSTLEWGPTPAYGNGPYPATHSGDNRYEFEITGLTPGDLYHYRVVVDGNREEGSFRAAPVADADRVVLYAYGDTRDYPWRQQKVLRRLLENVALAPGTRQTISLHSGDLVGSGTSEDDWQYEHFNRAYPWLTRFQSEIPFMATRGNHESSGTLFRDYYPYDYADAGDNYYSFDYGPVHVTVLDDQRNRDPGSDQYDWIDADLASTARPFKIVVFHEPAWGAGGGHSNDPTNQMLTSNIFEPRGVALASTGHNHYYARNEKDGIAHITTGGGGAPLHTPDPGSPYHVASSASFHFSRISIKDDTLWFTAFDWNGDLIDLFFIDGGADAGAPGVDGVSATDDALTVTVAFDECVEAGSGTNGAENPANYTVPGFTVHGARLDDTRGVVRLSVLPEMAPGGTYGLTTRLVHDCATPPNTMSAPDVRTFRFDEGPGVVVEHADTWTWLRGQSDPGSTWNSPGHDTSGWSEGPTGFGYGDHDDATVLGDMQNGYTTVFARRLFDVCDTFAVRSMALAIDYDDGFAAYLNGEKVAGRNDDNFTGHNHDAVASASHEAGTWERIDLSAHTGLLRGGENVLAIVLLNAGLTSTDATLIPELELTGGYCTDTALPPETGPGPAEADHLVWVDQETLTWPVNLEATAGYRLYRGTVADLPNLMDTGVDSCVRLRTTHNDANIASDLMDDPAPVPGRTYWYLVTGVNSYGEGTAGYGTPGERQADEDGDCPE